MVRKPRRGGVAEENEVVERQKKRVSFVSGRGNETSGGGGKGGLGESWQVWYQTRSFSIKSKLLWSTYFFQLFFECFFFGGPV